MVFRNISTRIQHLNRGPKAEKRIIIQDYSSRRIFIKTKGYFEENIIFRVKVPDG